MEAANDDAVWEPIWSREQINAIGAFLVRNCRVSIEEAAEQAVKMLEFSGYRAPDPSNPVQR